MNVQLDVDCSGIFNSTGALLILRYSLGLSMDGPALVSKARQDELVRVKCGSILLLFEAKHRRNLRLSLEKPLKQKK
ncbi:MAG: hypothetical protein ACD_7C00266G0009 [uncultured bacterium]|nr:MAG: hypothetical protein ACD_7C00266G0009 [uncultured bacterium]